MWLVLGVPVVWSLYSIAHATGGGGGGSSGSDFVATMRTDSTAQLTLEGTTTPVHVTQGSAMIQNQAPTCVPSAGHPCNAVVNWFHSTFESVTVSVSEGTFTLDGGTIVLGPVPVQNQGSGFVVPAGTNTSFGGTVSGFFSDEGSVPPTALLGTAPLSAAATFNLNAATQDLTVSGTFPFTFTESGVTLTGTIAFAGAAQKPFLNVPPVANAGPDQAVACNTTVHLNGSGSTDADNNIASFTWLRNGAVIATGATPSITVPLGPSVITLEVRDAFGGLGTDTVLITSTLGNSAACCPAGTHIIIGTSNNDTLNGTAGSDCIIALGGQDTIHGNGGNDFISGGDGDDIIFGGTGNDLIFGGTGQDQLNGEDGDDTLSGDDGDDRLEGGNGNDVLVGGQGQDRLSGGAGINTCISGGGFDTFISCTTVQ
jgi:Ca2+-binding RTX toxin-like protein